MNRELTFQPCDADNGRLIQIDSVSVYDSILNLSHFVEVETDGFFNPYPSVRNCINDGLNILCPFIQYNSRGYVR